MRLSKTVMFILLITLLGFGFRFYKITSSPGGLYIDETSIGFNAWSIIQTGKDEHGKSWPLFFEAFGEYKLPVYIYLVALTQLFLGPTDLSVRLPAVVLGTLTIVTIFLLSKELVNNISSLRFKTAVPLFSGLLLAVSPWHFQFTHAGFEASAGLFFVVLGLYFFFKSKRLISTQYLVAAALGFVIALYAYNSARIVVPAIAVLLLMIYGRNFKIKSLLITCLIGIIAAIPFIKFALSQEGLSYPSKVTIFYQTEVKPIIKQMISNYWQNISPNTLFVQGETTIARDTPHRMSLLYLVNLPFFLVGLGVILKYRSRELLFMLIFWLLAFIPPAITTTNPHALRSIFAVPSSIFIIALGVSFYLTHITNIKFYKLCTGLYIFLLSVSVFTFLFIYHNRYALDAGRDWQICIKKATQRVLELQADYDSIYIEDNTAEWIAYLWYLKYIPANYVQTQIKNNLGKYHFGNNFTGRISKSGRNLYVTRKSYSEGKLIEEITYPNNSVAIRLWEI